MKFVILFFLIVVLNSCGQSDMDDNGNSPQEETGTTFSTETLMDRDDVVWGFDFINESTILFTQRSGTIGLLDTRTGEVTTVSGAPEVFVQGEGGLLDIRVHPDFPSNQMVYLCYAEPQNGQGRNAMARARLVNNELTNFQKIFTASHTTSATNHWGCRIEFDNSGHVFLSLGERADRLKAQDLSSHLGKILRFNEDGSVPQSNPFVSNPAALGEIYSLGHRNVQGLVFRPGTNELWASELGPVGGDEINVIRGGLNYGWPIISHGDDPGGFIEATSREGFVDPRAFWDPSISPSGIAFFEGKLYMANLSGEHIRVLTLSGTTVVNQELLFEGQNRRFRQIRVGPDGFLYFSTDSGQLVRMVPQ